MYTVEIVRSALKDLATVPKKQQYRIRDAIDALANQPRPIGSKKLQGTTDEYRIRVGEYRVVYRIEDKRLVVDVIRIANRKDVYRD